MNTHASLRATALCLALSLAPFTAIAQQPAPAAGDRSMEFRPGLGDAARERIPGGRLVVMAYSAVLLVLGGYVAFIARKASRLEGDVRRLEDDLARRAPDGDKP